jgi:YD repeat-containing protein
VTRASAGVAGPSSAYSRSETTAYRHDLAKWVIGQATTVTDGTTGKVMSLTDYDAASSLPIRNYSFGVLQQTLAYNADGTLASVKDGRNNVIGLSNWYRGIPRAISYPTGVSQSAVVGNFGQISSTTDELASATGYGYDAMGRLSNIAYPSGDTVAWNATARGFVPVAAVEYGIPAGHWKQTVQTGTGKTTTFYDGRWSPVLTLTEDTALGASKSFVVRRFDAVGRAVFSSYPVALANVNDILPGIVTQYDALGRAYQVKQDSELGVLTTTTEYLSGFQTRVTNPRGYPTTTSYQVFDAPGTDAPVRIDAPQGVVTTITRDGFGKPLQVTRSGPGG